MLKIGVLGAGRGRVMIKVLLEYREAQLVAICDKFQPALDQVANAAKEAGIDVALYNNFEDFLNHDMDAVILANYANEHAPFAIKCLKAGKHVLSEVLPCQTMAEAVELIETVEETGLVYAYAENYCYMDHTFEMWKKYKEGKIGEIRYGEGEYIHDCSSIWPQITYGDKKHWRNKLYPTFYCTHSLGPLLTISGKRPVKVVGFETPISTVNAEKVGTSLGTGIEMVTLENGAVLKSIHGDLKREPGSINYQVYCQNGMMESGRFDENKKFNYYLEGDKLCVGEFEKYDPDNKIGGNFSKIFTTHGGSDFYPTYCFIQKILGKPDGEWCIDVYTAVNMGICGILAWKSVLNGNIPIEIPDLSDPAQRDKYRNDNACTDPNVAGDELLPVTSHDVPEVSDEMYDKMKNYFEQNLDGNGDPAHYWDM